LLGFKFGDIVNASMDHGRWPFYDKDTLPLKKFVDGAGVRIVPGGSSVRDGAYIAPGVICMPPMYVNIGAYIGEQSLIDSHALVDIDSTTGREGEAGRWLTGFLRGLGYTVVTQPVDDGRFNVLATVATPDVVLSTHFDCVPPFFPSRVEGDRLYGRGSCDAKGILAAQVGAVEALRAKGERRVGLLFVVGEERGSDGARVANGHANGSQFLVDGEPTD